MTDTSRVESESSDRTASVVPTVRLPGRLVQPAVLACVIAGLGLLALNLFGSLQSLRSPTITESYADFARPTTLSFDDAMTRLKSLADSDHRTLATEATRIFHHGMAHVPTPAIERDGLAHYRMRVPAWENFLLFALSYLKPDTYRDYEFCSYRKALERGTGRCGQQSMALVGYLAERGVPTGFVALGGHAMATAEVSPDEWYILDPDYGGVIPMSLGEAEKRPEQVLEHYWNSAARDRGLDRNYRPERNKVTYGGPQVRYPRACRIERVTYVLKWAIPIGQLVVAAGLPAMCAWRSRRSTQSAGA